jgi:hypothetical protein
MKLTSAQVRETLNQYEGHLLPNDHQAVPQLNEWFGDHTFFLDSNGLSIVEPLADVPQDTTRMARVICLASWSDANCTKLARHKPEPTDKFVELASMH